MKYLGYHYDDSVRRFKELNAGKDKSGSNKKVISIYSTFARQCVFEFELQNWNQQTNQLDKIYVECPIYIPLYIDDYHFYIHGNKYTAPYQITDADLACVLTGGAFITERNVFSRFIRNITVYIR